jgi:peptidoglycan/LPS O-acetylase OafA/YrhL
LTQTAPESPPSKYIPGFDGLRALAAGGVIGCHIHLPGFGYGWIGVQLFFVLSGFLITGILLNSKRSPNYFINFYRRRIFRIFPIYYALLLLIIIIGLTRHWHIADYPWYVSFLDNWPLGMKGPQHVQFPPFLGHFWTLAVEEQFYLIWPLAVFLMPRRLFFLFIVVLLALGPVSRWLAPHGYFEPLWLFPADMLAWGAFGLVLFENGKEIKRYLLITWILLLTVSVIILYKNQQLLYELLSPLFLGIVILVKQCNTPVTAGLEWPPIRYLGKISYGLYLYHLPVIHLTDIVFRHYLPTSYYFPQIIVVLIATITIAALSYSFIERPLIKWAHRGVGMVNQRHDALVVRPAVAVERSDG